MGVWDDFEKLATLDLIFKNIRSKSAIIYANERNQIEVRNKVQVLGLDI